MRALVPLVVVGVLCSPVAAHSAELTAAFAYRFGEVDLETGIVCIAEIQSPCPTSFSFDGSSAYSLILDLPIGSSWMIELYAQRYESDLGFDLGGLLALPTDFGPLPGGIDLSPFLTDFSLLIPAKLELETFQVGLMKVWTRGRVEPFLVLGAGVTRIDASLFFLTAADERPSASLAAGVKFPIGKRLALRLETRTHWVDLPPEIADVDLFQQDVSAGLTFRW